MIDNDRKRTQDRGASSHKEGIAEYALTCAFMSCFFFNFGILQKKKKTFCTLNIYFVNHFEKA